MKFIAAACFSFLVACQSPTEKPKHLLPAPDTIKAASSVPATPDTTSLGGPWFLQPVLASDTAAGKRPMLLLDLAKSHFSGNTGCNTMRGTFYFSKKDSSLSFSDKIITTKMACPGYNEPAFMKSLRSTTHYRLRNGTLTLLSDDNIELSRWMRKPSVPSGSLKA